MIWRAFIVFSMNFIVIVRLYRFITITKVHVNVYMNNRFTNLKRKNKYNLNT